MAANILTFLGTFLVVVGGLITTTDLFKRLSIRLNEKIWLKYTPVFGMGFILYGFGSDLLILAFLGTLIFGGGYGYALWWEGQIKRQLHGS